LSSLIREVLTRLDPVALDRALQSWNAQQAGADEGLAITGKTLTTDALLTQRQLADYLIDHNAHYVFTVKDNQPSLREDIRLRVKDIDFERSEITIRGGKGAKERVTMFYTHVLNRGGARRGHPPGPSARIGEPAARRDARPGAKGAAVGERSADSG